MVFRSFRIAVLARIVLLTLTMAGAVFLVIQTTLYATLTLVCAFFLFQVYALVRYVEKTNWEIDRFLRSIQYNDFSQSFALKGKGKSFDALYAAFTEVMNRFRRERSEKEEHHQSLQTVIQHVGVGLISFRPDGQVEILNAAAKRLLKIRSLTSVRQIAEFSPELAESLMQLKSGEKTLVKVEDAGETLQLAINATEFRIGDQPYILASIQNIRSELEEKEMEAWQMLIRVLTHEIMNSITPISSLASTVNSLLRNEPDGKSAAVLPTESVDDIRGAVQTIEKRSQGLLHFVEAYRNLTRIPAPEFQIVRVMELFGRTDQLIRAHLGSHSVALSSVVDPPGLEVTADPNLIEQILLNLLLNAVQALRDRPGGKICLSARMNARGRVVIEVNDNGPGIPKDMHDRIFIPFFTTKKDGSGIGLSLSRQIMRLHRGSITVRSEPNAGATFSLLF